MGIDFGPGLKIHYSEFLGDFMWPWLLFCGEFPLLPQRHHRSFKNEIQDSCAILTFHGRLVRSLRFRASRVRSTVA